MNRSGSLIVAAMAAFVVVACASSPRTEDSRRAPVCERLSQDISGGILVLNAIGFRRNSASLDISCRDSLRDNAEILKSRESGVSRVEIQGYASADEDEPVALGRARADAVRDDLLELGVRAATLTSKSYGAKHSNVRHYLRTQRVVEFVIVGRE